MLLLNGNRPVLEFSKEFDYIKVLDNHYLPFGLKDYIENIIVVISKTQLHHIALLRDWLANRVLPLSRQNAKAILLSAGLSQSTKTDDRLQIVYACHGLSMIDNFWVTDKASPENFDDLNLRNHHLRDVMYPISVEGYVMSVQDIAFEPDISLNGMFPKTWYRGEPDILLWKSDNSGDYRNVKAEYKVSRCLSESNVRHVDYALDSRDGRYFTASRLLANDYISIIDMFELKDWCDHTNKDVTQYMIDNFKSDFFRMCLVDYIFANVDRHLGNVHLFVDNDTNDVKCMSPLMDFNQALVSDLKGVDIDDMIYDPLNTTMIEAARIASTYVSVAGLKDLPTSCSLRQGKVYT